MAQAPHVYAEWLGLQGLEGPPNYYQLLDLPLLEASFERIEQAAQLRAGRVRARGVGGDVQLVKSLIQELDAARSCLVDPVRKMQYDNQLRQGIAPQDAARFASRDKPPATAGGDDDGDLLPPSFAGGTNVASPPPSAPPSGPPAGHVPPPPTFATGFPPGFPPQYPGFPPGYPQGNQVPGGYPQVLPPCMTPPYGYPQPGIAYPGYPGIPYGSPPPGYYPPQQYGWGQPAYPAPPPGYGVPQPPTAWGVPPGYATPPQPQAGWPDPAAMAPAAPSSATCVGRFQRIASAAMAPAAPSSATLPAAPPGSVAESGPNSAASAGVERGATPESTTDSGASSASGVAGPVRAAGKETASAEKASPTPPSKPSIVIPAENRSEAAKAAPPEASGIAPPDAGLPSPLEPPTPAASTAATPSAEKPLETASPAGRVVNASPAPQPAGAVEESDADLLPPQAVSSRVSESHWAAGPAAASAPTDFAPQGSAPSGDGALGPSSPMASPSPSAAPVYTTPPASTAAQPAYGAPIPVGTVARPEGPAGDAADRVPEPRSSFSLVRRRSARPWWEDRTTIALGSLVSLGLIVAVYAVLTRAPSSQSVAQANGNRPIKTPHGEPPDADPGATTPPVRPRPAPPADPDGGEMRSEPTKPEPTKPEPTKPEPTKPEPTKPEPTKPEPTKPEPTKPEPTKPEPTKPEPTKPEPPPVVDEAQVLQARKLLNEARVALSARNLDDAKRRIEEAGQLSKLSPEVRKEVQRVGKLHEYTAGFWNAVLEGCKGLKSGATLDFNDTVMSIVSADPRDFTIRLQGRNLEYRIPETIKATIAYRLAQNWLDAKAPSSKIYLGAIHAVDPSGSRDRARQLWQQAAQEGRGENLDAAVAEVLPELDVPFPE